MDKSIEPSIACPVGVSEAKTMAAVLVKVKFDGYARFEPGIDHTKLSPEKEIIGGYNIEHRRCVLRYLNRAHTSINRTYKGQLHGL